MNEEKKNIPELNCDIVRDLLPLYCDGVVSERSKEAVEEHLSHCDKCSKSLSELQKVLPTDNTPEKTKKNFGDKIKKINRKYRITFSITLILIIAAILLMTVLSVYIRLARKVITNPAPSEIVCYGVYPYDLDDITYYVAFINYPAYYSELTPEWSYNSAEKYRQLDLYAVGETSQIDKMLYKDNRKMTILFYDPEELSKRTAFGDLTPYVNPFDEIKNESFFNDIFRKNKGYGNEDVPEFVAYYIEYMTNSDTKVINWAFDENEYTIKATFKDGTFAVWDLDGNKLEDTRK